MMKTPKADSGKKLVQARLPFKLLATPSGSSSSKEELSEARKRKLSFDKSDSGTEQAPKKRPLKSGETNGNVQKKKEIILTKKPADVVLLSDSEDDNFKDDGIKSCSKENVKISTPATILKHQKQFESDKEADLHSDDVELEGSSDDECKKPNKTESAIKSTPTNVKICETKEKTPKPTKNVQKPTAKERKSTGEATAESKVLIKLPISTKKNKRRKTSTQAGDHVKELANSDDVELASPNQLQKRAKLEDDIEKEVENKQLVDGANQHVVNKSDIVDQTVEKVEELKQNTTEANKVEDENKPIECKETKEENIEEEKKEGEVTEVVNILDSENEETNETNKVQVDLEKVSLVDSSKPTVPESEEEISSESDTNKSKTPEQSSTLTDEEADAETETTNKTDVVKPETKVQNSIETPTTPTTLNENSNNKLQKKNLTPKQQKLLEQRLKAREEKERKIQEERLQKQREKEERELAKKREREEKEELKRKEREEKEDQRRQEREEKERKRLADLELKNEEKRKRNEAKEEELRKKEEDRKRKEQEKEEAELKKKKAAMAFTKFFSRPAAKNDGDPTEIHHEPENNDVVLAFRPFQIKGAMKLAPIIRTKLNDEAKKTLETMLEEPKELSQTELYVPQLKAGVIKPQKWMPPVQKDEIEEIKKSRQSIDDDDVIIVEDELESAGQAIVEEPVVPVERLRVKYYRFHENRRPPYYGTWRKKSKVISARRPFALDKQFFDYEVDSDDEWEEEEPGESLDGSDDDKEKESEDEDYEVDNDWFVPHGHLSDEEMQGEDDLAENNDREAQKAKLQILQKEFAQEMKKKTEKIKPRLVGCIWVDENGNHPELCPKIIWDSLNTRAILCAEPPVLEEIETKTLKDNEANGSTNEKQNGETKLKPISLTKPMLKQLIKLVHGNTHSKNFIIQEFIAYIEANEESIQNGDVKGPLKSAVREKIDQFAQWQIIEKSETEEKDNNNSAGKKKKNKKKLCWVVSGEALQEMDMEALNLINDWEYILKPQKSKATSTKIADTSNITLANGGDDSNEHSETSVEQNGSPSTKNKTKTTDIKKFTKVLTTEEKAKQLEKSKELIKTPNSLKKDIKTTTPTASNNISSSSSSTPNTKTKNFVSINSNNNNNNNNNKTPTVKKRVPLLMSVARGQAISTPDKNERISKFLKTLNDAKQKEKDKNATSTATPIPMEVDDVIVLDD